MLRIAPCGRRFAATFCMVLLAAGSARAEISQSESAKEYAARVARQLERVTAERDAALEALEAERKKAKEAVERTVGKAVGREALLAEARRRIAALEAEAERLRTEVAGLVESQRQSELDHAKREAELIDRARTADHERSEAERLEQIARADAEEARAEAEEARARTSADAESAREAASVHARQLGDLQTHILDLEARLANETEKRLANGSDAPIAVSLADGAAAERIATLEKELESKTAELALLEQRSASERKELRAARATRADLERQLEEARQGAPAEATTAEWAVEDLEPPELRRLLAIERERRSTLEGELVRLSATGDLAERYRESWQALQAARADLLLLSERLSAEQQKREDLEAMLERARSLAGDSPESSGAPLGRLIDVANEHGRETERLAAELRQANDQLTKLRGHLETIEGPDGGGAALARLDEENAKLKTSLQAAEKTIGRLTGQAALAERLAELVYSRKPAR